MTPSKPVAASAVLVALMLAASAWAWPHAPARMPTHWGVSGAPDGWSPRAVALLLMPAFAAVLTAVFAVLPALMPKGGRLERSARAYARVWIGTVLLLALIHAAVLAAGLGAAVDMTRVAAVGVGGLLVVLGDLMGKVRFNYVMGVRTPWTLADERVWDRTHRAVGPWFMGWGVLVAAAGLAFGGPGVAIAAGAGGAAVVGGAVTYSYLAARRLGVA